jgi:hypothetical protein
MEEILLLCKIFVYILGAILKFRLEEEVHICYNSISFFYS